MKREAIPVVLRRPDGTPHTLGHVSRVSRQCVASFMRRRGFDVAAAAGAPSTSWEFFYPASTQDQPIHKAVMLRAGAWIIEVTR